MERNVKHIRKKYSPELKEALVLISYKNNQIVKLEKEFGLSSGALTRWRQEHEKNGNGNIQGEFYLRLREEQQKINFLENKIKKTETKFEILKAAGKALHQGRLKSFQFIKQNEKKYSIRLMCETLKISRSEYYKWKNHYISDAKKYKRTLQKKIEYVFIKSDQRYGSDRITAELQNSGILISLSTVKKYMKEMGIRSRLTNTMVNGS